MKEKIGPEEQDILVEKIPTDMLKQAKKAFLDKKASMRPSAPYD